MTSRKILFAVAILLLAAVGSSTVPGFAQQSDLIVTDAAGSFGDFSESSVFIETGLAIQGWSIGICHDPAQATLISISEGPIVATANGGLGADFVNTTATGDGWIGSVIVDIMSIATLPAASGPVEIHRATYEMAFAGSAGVCFCDTLGAPQVSQVVLASGMALTPALLCAPSIGSNVPFRRGDANIDGAVGVADVIRLLNFLFAGGLEPDCLDAADTNDDGRVDVGDPVQLLSYLFQIGVAPPPAPGPHNCGVDDQIDLLPECQYNGC